VRRSNGSINVTCRSGRAIAQTSPGSPAPDPTSATVAPCGTRGTTTAQFRMCRSQIRGTSRGPINPRSTPAEINKSTYCSASGSRSANTPAADDGGVSRETGTISHGHMGERQDAGRMTTWRPDSSPSDSLTSPASATVS
jgi:hypothetical protein